MAADERRAKRRGRRRIKHTDDGGREEVRRRPRRVQRRRQPHKVPAQSRRDARSVRPSRTLGRVAGPASRDGTRSVDAASRARSPAPPRWSPSERVLRHLPASACQSLRRSAGICDQQLPSARARSSSPLATRAGERPPLDQSPTSPSAAADHLSPTVSSLSKRSRSPKPPPPPPPAGEARVGGVRLGQAQPPRSGGPAEHWSSSEVKVPHTPSLGRAMASSSSRGGTPLPEQRAPARVRRRGRV